MSKKLIYINACMHDDSRTLRIAAPIVKKLSEHYEIETVCLDKTDYRPVDRMVFQQRADGYVPEDIVALSKRIAAADRIVIAAPFWDMSFPSILKVFFENMSLYRITFESADNGFRGLCRCEKVMYITTRGMDIDTGSPLEQATPYINALGRLWGLGELSVISAQNMDFSTPEEVEKKIGDAVKKGLEVAKNW